MAFKVFTNRSVQYPNRRKLTLVAGTTDVYDIAREEGTVFEEGVMFNEANMGQLTNEFELQLAEKANKSEVTNVMTPKGNIAYASLPTTGNEVGWYYYCPDGDGTNGPGNYAWNGTTWYFAGTGDEGYNILKNYMDNHKANKIFSPTNNAVTTNVLGHVTTQALTFNDTIGTSIGYAVEPGQVLYVSGRTYPTSIYPIYMFFYDNTYISKYDTFEANKYYEKLEVTVPIGANKIIVNGAELGNYAYPKVFLSSSEDLVDVKNELNVLENKQKSSEIIINNSNIRTVTEDVKWKATIKNGFYPANSKILTETIEYNAYEVDVKDGYQIRYIGRSAGTANIYDIFRILDTYGNIINYVRNEGGTVDYDKTAYVPENGVKVVVTSTKALAPTILVTKTILNESLHGKKIVWFGTSIPAGSYNRGDKYMSYPLLVGEKLGITVYNESVGESKVHTYRSESAISESNPYGITSTDYITTAKCLSNTLDMQEWLIANYQNPMFITGLVASMTDEKKAEIRSWSYQSKIDKYLTYDTFPDLFVFDHGRNDMWISQDWTFNENAPYSLYNASYRSAMNFLIKHILEYNPKAKIVIMGHYTSQIRNTLDGMTDHPDKIAQGQIEVSEYWEIPIFKLWEHTGWSNKTINYKGENQSVLATWLPDKLHPHSDTTGRAINHIANLVTPFVRDNL